MPKIAFLTFTGPAHTKTAEITADKISKTSITGLFTKYKNIFPITSKSRKNSTAVNTAGNDTASTAAAAMSLIILTEKSYLSQNKSQVQLQAHTKQRATPILRQKNRKSNRKRKHKMSQQGEISYDFRFLRQSRNL